MRRTTKQYRRPDSVASGKREHRSQGSLLKYAGIVVAVAMVGILSFVFGANFGKSVRTERPMVALQEDEHSVKLNNSPLSAAKTELSAREIQLKVEVDQTVANSKVGSATQARVLDDDCIIAKECIGPSRHTSSRAPVRVAAGSFKLKANLPDVKEVICDWLMPTNKEGVPTDGATDIVVIFPYPTEVDPVRSTGKKFAYEYGFTVIGLRFPGMEPVKGVPTDDKNRFYYYPESGSGEAYCEAISRIKKMGGLGGKKVIAYGRSGGGSSAGLFANAYPELVECVVNEAGRVFPEDPKFNGPTLLLHGAHDYVSNKCIQYEEKLRSLNIAVSRVTFPPTWSSRGISDIWQHGITRDCSAFMEAWICGVSDLRGTGGAIPKMSEWPYDYLGVKLPNNETWKALRRVAKPSVEFSIGGCIARVAMVPEGKESKGVVVLYSNGDSTEPDEMALDVEYFSDNSFHVVGLINTSNTIEIKDIASLFDRADMMPMAGKPWWLIVEAPDIPFRQLKYIRPVIPNGIVFWSTMAGNLRSFFDGEGFIESQIGYLDTKVGLSKKRSVLPSNQKINEIFISDKTKNSESFRQARLQATVEWINKNMKK